MALLLRFLVLQQKSINEWLQRFDNNADVDSCTSQDITLVLGNEACDLDSVVSALLWSYYMQSETERSSTLFIPVLNIPKKELKLRKETLHLLEQIDKSFTEHLFFQDTISKILSHYSSTKEVDANQEEKQSTDTAQTAFKLNVHLMDHNALSVLLHPLLGHSVNYIVDHHKDEGKYLEQCNKNKNNRVIEVCGSNVSLIINHILSANKNYDISTLSKTFGALINAVILLDTGAFDKQLGKTTNIDRSTYKLCEKHNLNQDHIAWYQSLLALRINVDGFDFSDLLVKDLKIYKENEIIFGIPGLGVQLQDVMDKEGEHLFEAIHLFQVEKKLDVVSVMTIFSDTVNNNRLQRELALFSENQSCFDNVSNLLQQQQNKEYLGLQPISIKPYEHKNRHVLKSKKSLYYQWWKMDIGISRKKLAPLLRTILSKL